MRQVYQDENDTFRFSDDNQICPRNMQRVGDFYPVFLYGKHKNQDFRIKKVRKEAEKLLKKLEISDTTKDGSIRNRIAHIKAYQFKEISNREEYQLLIGKKPTLAEIVILNFYTIPETDIIDPTRETFRLV